MGHPSIRARLQVLLALFALAFLALAFFQYGMARRLFITMLEHDLRGDVIMLSERLEADKAILVPARIDSLCKAISPRKGFRITVTDSEGVVIGDSHVPADKLGEVENHRHRPEFVGASREGWGSHLRSSATVRQEMVYVAHRLPTGHYLRIAAGSPALEGFRRIALTSVGLYLGLFVLGALFVTLWVWRRISLPLLQLQRGQHETDKPLRWNAPFREAEVLNQAFDAYVGDIRRLHANVAKEHDRLIEVLNLLEEGVLLLSPTGEVHNLNPAAVKLLAPGGGIPQVTYASASDPASGSSAIDITADWVGRNLAELAAIPDLALFLHDVSRGERPPVLLIDKSEACPRDLLCHLRSLRGDGGEWLLTLVDVSEFRQLDRVKSEFVANASHELKTPLASIRGYAESLIDGAMHDTKAREPFIRKILHNALRLESLIGDLLSLSRLEADKGPRNVEPLPLRRYFNQAAGLFRAGLESSGVRFENHIPEEIEVLAEPRDLELIVNNLFGNAVKYNKPGGKVKVIWDTLPHGGRLTVKDSGVGIPTAMLPRIFERFYRADTSRARQEGTGLGLAIVKHACQRYQFTVKAESEMGEGSRFIVEIPGKSIKRA